MSNLWKNPPGKLVLALVLLGNAVYGVMVLVTVPALVAMADGLQPLDPRINGYDAVAVTALFEALGEEGRLYYRSVQIPVDLVYPGLFMIYALLLWRWLWLQRGPKALTTIPVFGMIAAVAGGVFDYAENLSSLFLLQAWPIVDADLVQQASFYTQLKFSFVSITLLMLLVYGAWAWIRRPR